MFPRSALLTIGLFAVWCFLCQQWYVCHIKGVCGDTVVQPAPIPASAPDTRPLVFNWSDPAAITRASFPTYRDSIVKALTKDNILEIIGLYFKGETSPKDFPNMGMARAAKIKGLFGKALPVERMLVSSRLINEKEGVREKPFESVLFHFLEETKEEKVEIVEVENRIIIHFPFNKAVKEADPKVDQYLEKLSQRLKQTNETVTITGHTDDIGDDKSNIALGRSRAVHIRDILIKKGIKKDRITIFSKGESQPIAENDSEAGRRRNRRAVLQLNKKE